MTVNTQARLPRPSSHSQAGVSSIPTRTDIFVYLHDEWWPWLCYKRSCSVLPTQAPPVAGAHAASLALSRAFQTHMCTAASTCPTASHFAGTVAATYQAFEARHPPCPRPAAPAEPAQLPTLRLARRLKDICTVPRFELCGGDWSGRRVAPLEITGLGIPDPRGLQLADSKPLLPCRTTITGLQGERALPARSTHPFISRPLQTELGACPQAPTAPRWLISTRDRLGRAAAGQMRKRRPRTSRCGAAAGGARWTSPRWL